jgi:DNA invertase Pin-like site-specific DNA recombinase
MKIPIEIEKTTTGWKAKCSALRITGKGDTKSKAVRAAKKAVNTFLGGASAREVFARMARQMEENARVIAWLGSEDALRLLGRGFALRVEVAASIWNGRSLAAIAREYHTSRQTVSKVSQRLKRRVSTQPLVDTGA